MIKPSQRAINKGIRAQESARNAAIREQLTEAAERANAHHPIAVAKLLLPDFAPGDDLIADAEETIRQFKTERPHFFK